MLTIPEMTDAREKLSAASALVDAVRVLYLSTGSIDGARLLNDVVGLIGDEIAALDKAINRGRLAPDCEQG